jgi:hypothetical protein
LGLGAFTILGSIQPLPSSGATATLSVNAGITASAFRPVSVFGNNINSWTDPRPVSEKIQASGNLFLRFPGGSWSDIYHWNGTGSMDSNGWWAPSATTFTRGGTVEMSRDAAKAVDNNPATSWRSHPETDFPNAQWLHESFSSNQSVNAVTLVWGDPYATRFTVQYLPLGAYANSASNPWVNTSAVNVTGAGGTQGVTFNAVTTRMIRVLMIQSSAGAGGVYSVAKLDAFNGATLLAFCNSCEEASSTDPGIPGPPTGWISFHFEQFMAMMNAMTPPGVPLITVNFGSGTPQEAAAWVRYANVVRGYGIRYWEIGNEMGGEWEPGGPLNAPDYARRYIQFYEAMKAEDPTITVLGPVSGFDSPSCYIYDGKSYIESFVDRLAAVGKAHYAEAISYHYYDSRNTFAQHMDQPTNNSRPDSVANMAASIASQLSSHPAAATVPVFLTEFNSFVSGVSVRLENGLWLARFTGEFIRNFGERGCAFLWDAMNGGDEETNVTGDDHGYLNSDGVWQYQERATYWAFLMMTQHWSGRGDAGLHRLTFAASSQNQLSVYANRRPDDSLCLMVVNVDPSNAYDTTLYLNGYLPVSVRLRHVS